MSNTVTAETLSANESDPLYVPLNKLAFRRDVRVYAVMDGAMFEDLPVLLAERNLSARSLYRDGTDEGWVEAGPWLIDPYRLADGRDEEDDEEDDGYGAAVLPDNDVDEGDEELADEDLEDQADFLAARMKAALEAGDETGAGLMPTPNPDPDDPRPFAKPVYPWPQVRALIELAEGSPGLVFWVGEEGLTEPQLHRHLRTINKVLIPAGYGYEDEDGARAFPAASPMASNAFEGGAAVETHEAVQFRHADGNVLAEVMPVLNEAQFARLFGPARLLVFTAPDHPANDGSILYEAPLPPEGPAASAGLLRLSMALMEAIKEKRLERSRNRVIDYLREVDPDAKDGKGQRDLYRLVSEYEASGEAHGLQSERAQMKWAYLNSVSNGEIGKHKETKKFFAESKKHPDDRVDDLMDIADEAWDQIEGAG